MIIEYSYDGKEHDFWKINHSTFKEINLLVGSSGSGKSSFLNSIFGIGSFVAKGIKLNPGNFYFKIKTEENVYEWDAKINYSDKYNNVIDREVVRVLNNGNKTTVIDRDSEKFIFNGINLPKLQSDISGISLLKEEDVIIPLYKSFSRIMRRLFHDSGLAASSSYEQILGDIVNTLKKDNIEQYFIKNEHTVSTKLYLLENFNPDTYKKIVNLFIEIFPFVKKCRVVLGNAPGVNIVPNGIVPIFQMKEDKVKPWINLQNMSSGMQKVLLIISDILTLPDGSIYIIDEYENSLGINAIDFLPEFLVQNYKKNTQFFITTHHPYLINNMPISDWRLFHRVGSEISIKKGEDLESKYGKSKQKAFMQLINDPFYTGEI